MGFWIFLGVVCGCFSVVNPMFMIGMFVCFGLAAAFAE